MINATVTVYTVQKHTVQVHAEDEKTAVKEALRQTLPQNGPDAALYSVTDDVTGEETVFIDRDHFERLKEESCWGAQFLDIDELSPKDPCFPQNLTQSNLQQIFITSFPPTTSKKQ